MARGRTESPPPAGTSFRRPAARGRRLRPAGASVEGRIFGAAAGVGGLSAVLSVLSMGQGNVRGRVVRHRRRPRRLRRRVAARVVRGHRRRRGVLVRLDPDVRAGEGAARTCGGATPVFGSRGRGRGVAARRRRRARAAGAALPAAARSRLRRRQAGADAAAFSGCCCRSSSSAASRPSGPRRSMPASASAWRARRLCCSRPPRSARCSSGARTRPSMPSWPAQSAGWRCNWRCWGGG